MHLSFFCLTLLLFSTSSVISSPVSWNSGPDAGSSIGVGSKRRHLASRTKEQPPEPPDGLAQLRARANPGDSRHTAQAAHGRGKSVEPSLKTHSLSTSARNSSSIQPTSSTLISSTRAPTKPERHPQTSINHPSNHHHTGNSASASSDGSASAQSASSTTGSGTKSTARPAGRPQKTPSPVVKKPTYGGTSNTTGQIDTASSNQKNSTTEHGSTQHGAGRILEPTTQSNDTSASQEQPGLSPTAKNGTATALIDSATTSGASPSGTSNAAGSEPTTQSNDTSASQGQPGLSPTAKNGTATASMDSAITSGADFDDESYINEYGDGGDTTSDAASPSGTSSSDNSQTSSGTDGPAYNLKKLSCKDYPLGVTAEEEWDAADGDNTMQAYVDMFNNDRLYCRACYNRRKEDCQDKSSACARGLKTASQLENSGDPKNPAPPNWSLGVALFAQYGNAEGYTCKLGGNNPCSVPPTCDQCNYGDGAGSSALLKSISNAYTSFQKTHDAISEARDQCMTKMALFSDTFAPVPDGEGQAMAMIIMTSLFGGMFGFLPGIGGAIGGMAAGLGTGVGMEKYFSSRPGPGDTSASLGTVVDDVLLAFGSMMDDLFTTGEHESESTDGRSHIKISMQDMMSGGALVHPDGDWNSEYQPLVDRFRKTFFQQLALITWQNLQVDKKKHVPFISFEKGACDKVDKKDEKLKLYGSLDHDSQIDYDGDCYYLFDGVVDDTYSVSGETIVCNADKLPGATNEIMSKNSDDFAQLTLGDWIIPSVLGWRNHSNQNGYQSTAANGDLITDPQAPGVVNLPVCDYEGNFDHPGIGCPKLGTTLDKSGCAVVPASEGNNLPGQYSFGSCKAHVEQWQKLSLKNNANQLPDYQIQIDIYDQNGRAVGSATKQDAKDPLEVSDTSLPYNLIVVPGGGDDDPMRFWYADQYWDSSDKDKHKCSNGKYNDGSHFDGSSRQLDCNFDCPLPNPGDTPPKSATIDSPLPNPAVKAYPGPTPFVNTYSKAAPAAPTAAPTPTFAGGVCGMHITQYQRNEKDSHTGNNYQLEINVKDAKGAEAANLPKMDAPQDVPLPPMNGLKGPMIIRLGGYVNDKSKGEDSVIYFDYDGQKFDTQSLKCHKGGYEDGNRDMDCNFNCPN
ncbi:MAG: hypothetical protein Q9218_004459 [Villophora microphyllina]